MGCARAARTASKRPAKLSSHLHRVGGGRVIYRVLLGSREVNSIGFNRISFSLSFSHFFPALVLCTLARRLYALCNGSSNGGGVERRGREEKEAEFLSFFSSRVILGSGPFYHPRPVRAEARDGDRISRKRDTHAGFSFVHPSSAPDSERVGFQHQFSAALHSFQMDSLAPLSLSILIWRLLFVSFSSMTPLPRWWKAQKTDTHTDAFDPIPHLRQHWPAYHLLTALGGQSLSIDYWLNHL